MTALAWRLTSGGLVLALLAGGVALAMVVTGRSSVPSSFAAQAVARVPAAAGGVAPADSSVAASGLFRVTRAPAPLPFDPRGEQPAVSAAPAPLVLELAGVILGSVRAALIRGLPGQETAQVLTEGDEVNGVRLMSVDSVLAILVWRGDTVRLSLPRERS